MLVAYSTQGVRTELTSAAASPALERDIIWIDLLHPNDSEISLVERATSLKLPTREELSEIEASSRLRAADGVLYLSAPMVYDADSDDPHATPVGFVLTRDRLITVRFAELRSFSALEQDIRSNGMPLTSTGLFTGLTEAVTDRRRTRRTIPSTVSGRTNRAVAPAGSGRGKRGPQGYPAPYRPQW
jgi:magnesium transporter